MRSEANWQSRARLPLCTIPSDLSQTSPSLWNTMLVSIRIETSFDLAYLGNLRNDYCLASDRDLTPGALTSILSQGWLTLNKSYDSDYPHDPAPFGRRYNFGRPVSGYWLQNSMMYTKSVQARIRFSTENNFPLGISCELWCERGKEAPIGPYTYVIFTAM